MEADDCADFEKTRPSPLCDGEPGCPETVEVLFLRTGGKMCSRHGSAALQEMVAHDREERDTDKAPPDGSPTLPPLSDHE